jgi:hypothetical protein
MSTQAEIDLEARIGDLERQLAELAAKVNPLYSGGMDRYIHSGYLQWDGINLRLDKNGMQLQTKTGTSLIQFVPILSPNSSSVAPQAYVIGYGNDTLITADIAIVALAESSNSNKATVEAFARSTGDNFARLSAIAPDVTNSLIEAGVFIADSGANSGERGFFYIDHGPLLFRFMTADPTTILQDGMVWYNSTDDKLKARINGATKDLGGGGMKTSGGGYYLIPAGPAIGTSVTSSASANTYGSWTELRAASGNALYVVGIEIQVADATNVDYVQVDIGTGGAGSETSVGEAKIIARRHTISDQSWGTYKIELPYPIPVAASTRIACRTADDVASAYRHVLTLHVIDQADLVSI